MQNSTKYNNDNNSPEIFGRPQRVWEDEFPVGSASVFRARRKGDPDTKSGLGKIWPGANIPTSRRLRMLNGLDVRTPHVRTF